MNRRTLAIMLLCVAACSARQKGPDEPDPGERWVKFVRIEGNETLSDSDIVAGLASRKPTGIIVRRKTRLDPTVLEKDAERIVGFYQRRGFFAAKVAGFQLSKGARLATTVTFIVIENEPSLVAEVVIRGAANDSPGGDDPVGERALRSAVGIEPRARFDYDAYDRGKAAILSAAQKAGYAHAKLSARALADRAARTVVLEYDLDLGPLVIFGDIDVRGLKIMPESAVRNRLTFATGDRFDPVEVASSRNRVRALGRFGVVRVDFADSARNPVGDVRITVSEGPRRERRFGFGVAIDNSQWLARLRAGYTLAGFLDPLTTLTADVRPAYSLLRADVSERKLVGEASVGISREDLLLPLMRGSAKLIYDVEAFEAYSSRGPRMRLGLALPLLRNKLRVGAGYEFNLLCFSDIADEIDDPLRERLGLTNICDAAVPGNPYRLGFFEQSVAFDVRDNPLDARRGFYFEARLEEGSGATASEFSYTKLTAEVRGYVPVGDRLVIGLRARYGRSLSGTLPITRRYFAGGASSQRGFGQRRLSPIAGDIATSDIGFGGQELVESSAELRIDIVKLGGNFFGVALFTDAADVVDDGQSIDFTGLHVATGGGLRYNTPVGPVRFDVGYRVTRFGAGEILAGDRLAYHLSIGEAF